MKRIICLIPLFLVTGCANIQALENEPLSSGTSREYNAKPRDVEHAVDAAIPDVGLVFVSEKPVGDGTMFLAKRDATAFSWGENVRILILPSPPIVNVRIVSERVMATNVTAKDFTDDLFNVIQHELEEENRE